MTSLAEDSVRTKKFVVLLNISNSEIAREVLKWNCGQKIPLIGTDLLNYKWTSEHFKQLRDFVSAEFQKQPEDKHKAFLDMAVHVER